MINSKLFLKSIQLNNFATFENQTITFSKKFNTIVGETGSGKSLILEALQLVFGGRAEKKFIRKEAHFATIEAIFITNSQEVKNYFLEIGFPFENDEIVIKRNIYQDTPGKVYLNFQACHLNVLTDFARHFVDLVGQFENQKLLSEDYQLQLLDNYCSIDKDLLAYSEAYSLLSKKRKLLKELFERQGNKIELEDYLKFQINEIEKVNPSKEEENQLIMTKDHLLHQKGSQQSISKIMNSLTDGDFNVLTELINVSKTIEQNIQIQEKYTAKIREAIETVEEVSYLVSQKQEQDENIDMELENILEKLDSYQKIKRKHGGTLENVLDYYSKIKNDLANIEKLETHIVETTNEIILLEKNALGFSTKIHNVRSKNAKKLSELLTVEIQALKMDEAQIDIKIEKLPNLTSTGISKINFLAQTNLGEGFHSIKKIASGGELSRILLSIRKILSSIDSISVFLFDEIDTGVGGETALAIGKALKSVSLGSQVIAITHLPQIAFHADKIINVDKTTSTINGKRRTISQISEHVGTHKQAIINKMSTLN